MNPNKLEKKILTLEDVILEKGEEWRAPLNYARTTLSDKHLSDKNLIRLTKGRCTIPHLELMVRILFLDSKERPVGISGIDQFFYVVDRSEFNLFDWLEVFTLFHNWLETNQRKTPFPKMLGYLQCCEDSPENKDINRKFIELVQEMLEQHGFIG
ncbi:MAG: hypothetical protein H7281_10775 [Bacteriovorax sp.]|nr:hypothetical protein [Bacteriovorax sp.]